MKSEYETRGEYHKYLDKNWAYYPIYIRKINFIDKYLNENKNSVGQILDAGCGEGVLVEKYYNEGFSIQGIDLNVDNNFVKQGNIMNMSYSDNYFDTILLLDVIEHLNFVEQELALTEIKRVLNHHGKLIISIPNLAHCASRWNFFFSGELVRTANIKKHPGDRPIKEYLEVINLLGFEILQRFPIKFTLPKQIEDFLKKIVGEKNLENFIFSPDRNPEYCFLNIFILEKKLL